MMGAGFDQVTVGVALPTVYVTELGALVLLTRSCDATVNVWVPTELSTGLVSVPVSGVAGIWGLPLAGRKRRRLTHHPRIRSWQ